MATEMRELCWAAGFMEGEGSFTAVPAGRRSDGRIRASFNITVSCGQKEREPLERLKRLFGGNIYQHNMHTGYPIFRWQIAGNKAIGIMMTLWTLMSNRRRSQIELAIQRWKSARPAGKPKEMCRGR